MDGSRVAYASVGKIRVWNVTTGATSVVKGHYAKGSSTANTIASQLAIAGKRVAWVKDQQFGNTEEGEKLYTAAVGGQAHLVDHVYRHGTDDPSHTTGGWIEGLAGSGRTIAVSTWKSSGTAATEQELRLITPSGLSALAGGPDAIVSGAVDGRHIAVLRSSPWASSNSVGIYSRDTGAPVGEVDLGPPNPDTIGIQVSLSGEVVVVLTTALHQPSGPTTVTLEAYFWPTGDVVSTCPVGIHSNGGEVRFAVQAELAAVEGPSRLHLVNLATCNDVTLAHASHTDSPPGLDSRGLVYALNPHFNGPGKLVFVPMARLLALAS
jgi:hypothetical protein